ncbi:MAG: tetratricopeptide repeat protein [Desulfobulbaceae bacterium]|nr:MAG: tetratricopeptide repeat protein [Desulfobulbaceae bacterium]
MLEPKKPAVKTVRRDQAFFLAFACLVMGFLVGIVFSIYKMPGATWGDKIAAQHQVMSPGQLRVLESLEQKVATDPDNVQAWTQLGHLYFDANRFHSAIAAYTRSLELAPNNPDVLADLGVMYRRIGEPLRAVALFEQAIALNPLHETARFNQGTVLLHDLNDQAGALRVWQELVDINPLTFAPNGYLVSRMIEDLRQEQ